MPNIQDARWSAGWALVFIALFYTTVPSLAAMARLNVLETVYPQGTDKPALAYDAAPGMVQNLGANRSVESR